MENNSTLTGVRHIIMIAGIIVGAAIIAILLRTPLMRIPPPEEFMPTMARQELQSFHSSYRYFKNGHAPLFGELFGRP